MFTAKAVCMIYNPCRLLHTCWTQPCWASLISFANPCWMPCLIGTSLGKELGDDRHAWGALPVLASKHSLSHTLPFNLLPFLPFLLSLLTSSLLSFLPQFLSLPLLPFFGGFRFRLPLSSLPLSLSSPFSFSLISPKRRERRETRASNCANCVNYSESPLSLPCLLSFPFLPPQKAHCSEYAALPPASSSPSGLTSALTVQQSTEPSVKAGLSRAQTPLHHPITAKFPLSLTQGCCCFEGLVSC